MDVSGTTKSHKRGSATLTGTTSRRTIRVRSDVVDSYGSAIVYKDRQTRQILGFVTKDGQFRVRPELSPCEKYDLALDRSAIFAHDD